MRKPYNLSLPFDETFAWENFIKVLNELKQGETQIFYGFGRRFKFKKLDSKGLVLVTSQSLTEPEEIEVEKQRKFEKVFMSSILKETNRHLHTYVKSDTRHPDWAKQIYRCTHPDCKHYIQAQFIIGKRASCAACGEPFIIPREQIKNAKLVGFCCSKAKKAKVFRVAEKAISESAFNLISLNEPEEVTEVKLETPEEIEKFLKGVE